MGPGFHSKHSGFSGKRVLCANESQCVLFRARDNLLLHQHHSKGTIISCTAHILKGLIKGHEGQSEAEECGKEFCLLNLPGRMVTIFISIDKQTSQRIRTSAGEGSPNMKQMHFNNKAYPKSISGFNYLAVFREHWSEGVGLG